VKSPIQRRLAIAVLLLAPALGACGFSAQTDQVYQAAAGTNDRSGDVDVLNAVIVSSTDGSGTFAGSLVNTTANAAVLTSVTGSGVTAELAGGKPLHLAPYGSANLGAAATTAPLTVSGTGVQPGKDVNLTFTFATGATVTMVVPVSAVGSDYGDVPLPSPSSSTSPTDTPTKKKSKKATATATADATPSAY
jgi:hypothetical protein